MDSVAPDAGPEDAAMAAADFVVQLRSLGLVTDAGEPLP